jgi:hypothetical protein
MQPDIIEKIQELQVHRKFYIGLINKQTNACGALVRRALGFKWDEDDAARGKIRTRAAKIVTAILSGKEPSEEDSAVCDAISAELAVVAMALAPLEKRRKEVEKQMEKLARDLPAYDFVKAVAGFGDKAYAVLIGEVGDLRGYSKINKLWKRLGMTPYEGHAYSAWRSEKRRDGSPALTANEWIAAGYCPRRRAEMHACIADPMSKHQKIAAEKSGTKYGQPTGRYGEVYVARREHTEIIHPDWTKGHSRDDALRVMTKALISDLWSEWRRPGKDLAERPNRIIATPHSIAAE